MSYPVSFPLLVCIQNIPFPFTVLNPGHSVLTHTHTSKFSILHLSLLWHVLLDINNDNLVNMTIFSQVIAPLLTITTNTVKSIDNMTIAYFDVLVF